MENLSNAFGVGDKRDPDISIEMLDYKYIDECSNIKTLEKILKALKSGRDGYFPHLVKHCEEKVAKLNPKSRFLRTEKKIMKSRDLPNEEADKLVNGMGEWLNDMKSNEKPTNGVVEKELPPVRTNSTATKNDPSGKKSKKSQRIKGSDFRSWDKYDAEEECKKVDDPEFVSTKKKKITLSHTIDSSKMTESERQLKADKEKDKGNEAFKAGDFEEALAYYSRSISLVRTAASVNNRALTYLRLEKWKKAEQDCNEVLKLEKNNVKARLRRASALKELNRYEEAKKDLDFVLEVEPNNARAQKILKEVEPKIVKKGRRMKILEVEEDEEEQGDEALLNGTASHLQEKSSAQITPKAPQSGEKISNGANLPQVKSESKTKIEPEKKRNAANVRKENCSSSSEKSVKLKNTDQAKAEATTTPSKQESSKDAKSSVTQKQANQEQPQEKQPKVAESTPKSDPPKEVIQTPLPAELERIKREAGDLFRTGQYSTASDKYTKAINRLIVKAQNNPKANYSLALATLCNNRAACQLKSGNDKACIADCDRVLELKPGDVKALIRRGSAYEHMEKYKLAYDDFRSAQAIDWTAAQAQTGANRVAKHLRDVHGPDWQKSKEEKSSFDLPKAKPFASQKVEKATSKESLNEKTKKPAKPAPKNEENVKSSSKSSKPNRATEKPPSKPQKSNVTASSSSLGAQKQEKEPSKTDNKDEIRAKLSRDLFLKLKAEGNDLVRKGEYEKAVKSYTQCIKICPQEVASYTNRALCFLKLNQDSFASGDCAKALELDPRNVKAYYRRAQALKNLKFYDEALKDLKKVLEIEPANKPAISELAQVQKLVQASSKRKVPITDVSDEESCEEDETTSQDQSSKESIMKSSKTFETAKDTDTNESASNVHKTPPPMTEEPIISEAEALQKTTSAGLVHETRPDPVSDKAEKISKPYPANLADETKTEPLSNQTEKPSKPSPGNSAETAKPASAASETKPSEEKKEATGKNKSSAAKPKKSTRKERPATNIADFRMQVPENLTPYEFGNLWNSIQPKTNVEAYKCILDNISTDHIPAMVSNKTNDHLIVTFAHIALMHASTSTVAEIDRAYQILLQLTKADRFQMAAMFLSKPDKAVVGKAVALLENLVKSLPASFSNSDLSALKKTYML